MKKRPVAKLHVQSVPLTLQIDNSPKLELSLSWNMHAVMLMETRLRSYGIIVNLMRDSGRFWNEMNATTLAVAIWATAQQNDQDFADDEGLDVVASYLAIDTYAPAVTALRKAYLESLSEKTRAEIEAALKKAEEATAAANPTNGASGATAGASESTAASDPQTGPGGPSVQESRPEEPVQQ